jgi:hypothetical protein
VVAHPEPASGNGNPDLGATDRNLKPFDSNPVDFSGKKPGGEAAKGYISDEIGREGPRIQSDGVIECLAEGMDAGVKSGITRPLAKRIEALPARPYSSRAPGGSWMLRAPANMGLSGVGGLIWISGGTRSTVSSGLKIKSVSSDSLRGGGEPGTSGPSWAVRML